ncbi:hypothetical protein ACFV8T_01885 [Streptomyces sp. NPDC059832]|uniref:hypothetical protein n=1 Tax=Streptomyces sp. NPDC059832 TaxID=3346966 RepID=UPI00366344F7
MRDQHDRPTTHLARYRHSRSALVGQLLAHPLKGAFGDGEFVPFGPYLRQLLGRLFFEYSRP